MANMEFSSRFYSYVNAKVMENTENFHLNSGYFIWKKQILFRSVQMKGIMKWYNMQSFIAFFVLKGNACDANHGCSSQRTKTSAGNCRRSSLYNYPGL